jgi:hypothetical protein
VERSLPSLQRIGGGSSAGDVVAARAVGSAVDVVAGTTDVAGVVQWSWLERRLAQRDRAAMLAVKDGRASAEAVVTGCGHD